MQWDFKDQLQMSQRQAVNADDADGMEHQGERTYYVYDSAGQRARKVTERANGTLKRERIYLAGFEIYREYGGVGGTATLERETLHVMDDKRRVALVETKTVNADAPAGTLSAALTRYQFDNQLGSASLELNEGGALISYEEYYPFGNTSYQAGRGAAEVSLKRYRYTGKERDEETGLYYHGARYYAPWLGRWTTCDPAGFMDGPNLYFYARCNPTRFNDPKGYQSMEEEYGAMQFKSKETGRIQVISDQPLIIEGQNAEPVANVKKAPPPKPRTQSKAPKAAAPSKPRAPTPPSEKALNPKPPEPKPTDLDKAAKLAGIANFQTTDKEGVSGGIPGGTGPKENASELGQLAYLAVSVVGIIDLARGIWSLGKAAVGAVGSAYRTVAGRLAGDRALREGLKDLIKEEAQRKATGGAAASAAQAQKLKSALAAQHVVDAERVGTGGKILNERVKGSGLKSDPTHRAPSYLTEGEIAEGTVTPIVGDDGVRRTLVQVPSQNVNGKEGIVEYIIDHDGTITHQRFIEGGVIGAGPNNKVSTGL
jgi:RHS repeat-associated protein